MSGTRAPDRQATTVGVTGAPCRSLVSSSGEVTPLLADGDLSPLSWYVAAEDRWHVPSAEPAVRQRRIDGTPVLETRLRVPDGDAVQRVWCVPDGGGLTVIEVENESPLPFAVAFAGRRVLTERPPADVPIQGIELPEPAIVLPVGHRAVVRVAVPHDPGRHHTWALPRLAPAMAVVRGWTAIVHRASRLVLPDERLVDEIAAARSDLLLEGPVDADDDPVGFLFDVAELGRLGEDADAWLPEIVEPLAAVAKRDDGEVDAAVRACVRLAIAGRDERAATDIERVLQRRRRDGRGAERSAPTSFSDVVRGASAGRFVSQIEHRIADGGRLLPSGLPRPWLGSNFEVHHVPTGPRSSVSFAVRWHGDRPAVLWEQHGPARSLSAPVVDAAWTTDAVTGEALWAPPRTRAPLGVSIDPGER